MSLVKLTSANILSRRSVASKYLVAVKRYNVPLIACSLAYLIINRTCAFASLFSAACCACSSFHVIAFNPAWTKEWQLMYCDNRAAVSRTGKSSIVLDPHQIDT
ncbi:hypothetical protein CC77DRAFT_551499 [Alternaria alternata]|uniref:Uncharacterized protein n=1 Tax=Alternaria alternata TaxID=5599 RepID=A0A177D4P7_ALTAL|nr:hypothetical protein CC77DRAFT_551499 [Alternaria alternata]OAG14673.1 hypothetical protein CC77DRAFT_551499 [Alternaria alternata]